jgi:hypothetical protein
MLRAWLASRRNRDYRRAVRAHVGYLLFGLRAPEMDWLKRSFPEIWNTADDMRQRGESEYEAAILITGFLLTHVIENVMSDELRERTRAMVEAWGEGGPAPSVEVPANSWAVAAILLERRTTMWVAANHIKPTSQQMLLSEVVGALMGLTREQRSNRRLFGALAETFAKRRGANMNG